MSMEEPTKENDSPLFSTMEEPMEKMVVARKNAMLGHQFKLLRFDKPLFNLGDKDKNEFTIKDKTSRFVGNCKTYRDYNVTADFVTERIELLYHAEGGFPEGEVFHPEERIKYKQETIENEDIKYLLDKWVKKVDDNFYGEDTLRIEDNLDLEEEFHLESPVSSELASTYSCEPCHGCRPLTALEWLSPGYVLAAHADNLYDYRKVTQSRTNLYVWNIEVSCRPFLTLTPKSPAYCIDCDDDNVNTFVSGHMNGGLALWDVRLGPRPALKNKKAHVGAVRAVRWTMNETGYEFFSGGSDGCIKWWDFRKLDNPVEEIVADISEQPRRRRALGITALEINAEEPHKFMVGTETGHILYGDRTAENPDDRLVVNWRRRPYLGPVKCLERHDEISDVVISCGDFTVKMFNDELMGSPIMSLPIRPRLVTWATWSPSNPAVVHSTREDGFIETWNLNIDLRKPINSLQVCGSRLLVARCRQEGDLIALGTEGGDLHLVRFTPTIFLGEDDEDIYVDELFHRQLVQEKLFVEADEAEPPPKPLPVLSLPTPLHSICSESDDMSLPEGLPNWNNLKETKSHIEKMLKRLDEPMTESPKSSRRPSPSSPEEATEDAELAYIMGEWSNAEVETCDRNFWKVAEEVEEYLDNFRTPKEEKSPNESEFDENETDFGPIEEEDTPTVKKRGKKRKKSKKKSIGGKSKKKVRTKSGKKRSIKPKKSFVKAKTSKSKRKRSLGKPKTSMSKPKKSLSKPKKSISKPKRSLSKPKASMSKPKRSLNKPKTSISKPQKPLSKPKISSNEPKKSSSKKISLMPQKVSTTAKTSLSKPKEDLTKAKTSPSVSKKSPKKNLPKNKLSALDFLDFF